MKERTKKKKMAMQMNKKRKTADDERTINGLPESVLQHILSFLDMKQVVQTSLVARSWRYLWISLPALNFKYINPYPSQKQRLVKRNQEKFMGFVDNVLLLRDNTSINRLQLHLGDFCDNSGRIQTWVTAAVRRKVEEVSLQVTSSEPLELPHCMFASGIKELKLQSSNNYFTRLCSLVQPPITMASSVHLKTLQLTLVTLPEPNSDGELYITCRVLESLIISNCNYQSLKILSLSTPQLNNLVLENGILCNGVSCAVKHCKLKIMSAPRLKSLNFKGCMYKEYTLENLSIFLPSADIDLGTCKGNILDKYEWAKQVIKVLTGICNAQSLTLSASSLEAFVGTPHMLWSLPKCFPTLAYLKLTNFLHKGCARAILKLLMSSISLQTLILQLQLQLTEVQDWTPDFPSQELHSRSLKFVEMHQLKGCESELRFLKYIMDYALDLEKLTIITRKVWSRGEQNKLMDFSEKLHKLRRRPSLSMLFILKSGIPS